MILMINYQWKAFKIPSNVLRPVTVCNCPEEQWQPLFRLLGEDIHKPDGQPKIFH